MTQKNGPPEIPASDLWLALTAIPRPHRLVDFPRKLPGSDESVGKVAIWPLSQEEQMASNTEADRFTKELLKDPQRQGDANIGYHHTFSNETAVQILFRACRDENDLAKAAFPSPKMLRQQLTADEVGVLFKSYLSVQSEVGPIVAYMDAAEMDAWLRRLAEGGELFPLDVLSSEMRDRLLMHSASRLLTFWTDTSSAGKPPSDTSSTSDDSTSTAPISNDEPGSDDPADTGGTTPL